MLVVAVAAMMAVAAVMVMVVAAVMVVVAAVVPRRAQGCIYALGVVVCAGALGSLEIAECLRPPAVVATQVTAVVVVVVVVALWAQRKTYASGLVCAEACQLTRALRRPLTHGAETPRCPRCQS